MSPEDFQKASNASAFDCADASTATKEPEQQAATEMVVDDIGGSIAKEIDGQPTDFQFERTAEEAIPVAAIPQATPPALPQTPAARIDDLFDPVDAWRTSPPLVYERSFPAKMISRVATIVLGGISGMLVAYYAAAWIMGPRFDLPRIGLPFIEEMAGQRAVSSLEEEKKMLLGGWYVTSLKDPNWSATWTFGADGSVISEEKGKPPLQRGLWRFHDDHVRIEWDGGRYWDNFDRPITASLRGDNWTGIPKCIIAHKVR